MSTLTLEPQLYERVERAAHQQKASVDQILAEAIRQYLWELDRRKISEESQAYRRLHADLRTKYLGQHIALHEGQVVDHDVDLAVLRQRVRQCFGPIPVLITLVEDVAERPLTRHGLRTEAANP